MSRIKFSKKEKESFLNRMRIVDRAVYKVAEEIAKEKLAARHDFHEPYEKTPAQIKADERAKKSAIVRAYRL